MPTIVPKAEIMSWIGKDMPPGEWFEIDQQRINQFADVTVDHQFIHIDPEKAAQTPFGSTIAHGFLTLSMLTHLTSEAALLPQEIVMGINYGFDKVRFLNPVKSGGKVRALVKIADITEKDNGQILVKQAVTVEIEGEETPALVCEWLAMYVCG